MHRYTFTVPADIRATRLFPLVRRMLPELPEYAIREAFLKRDVKMNGYRARKDDEALAGAQVQLYTTCKLETRQVEIVYEDENLLVIRKPAGMSCQTDAKGGKTVVQWVGEWLRKRDPMAPEPLLCHRLDNQTDGLLILAKHEQAQNWIKASFQKRDIHKAYVCLVKGTPGEDYGYLKAYLKKDSERGRVWITRKPSPNTQEILTEYKVLQPGEISRIQVILHTGRTHQIRAHMAEIGHPVLGDDLYGDRDFNRTHKAKGLMLCATELWFSLDGELSYLNDRHFQIQPMF